MEQIKNIINKITINIKEHKQDYKFFLISLLIFNVIIIGIAELTIIHPIDFFKKNKYEHKKTERKIEKKQ
jgi:hypoxanthine-guanine phosphoribosyltransferase